MIGYKCTDKDGCCRGFKFEVGKTYTKDTPKEEHKTEIETCGGFLKTLEYKEAWKLAWDKASVDERKELFDLPNWDNEVFKEITGIDAEAEIGE